MDREQLISQTFVELADTLVAEFDAIDVLHMLADAAVELIDVDAAAIIFPDQRTHLRVVASTSHDARLIELLALQNDEGPCLDCFNSGQQVVNVSNGEATERWPKFTAAATDLGFRSTHALPLHLRDQVIGAMSLFCASDAILNDASISLGQALADVATISLLQDQNIRHTELLATQLQAALNSRILLEQAKGTLAARADVDVELAFTLMRDYSRRTQQSLNAIARAVLDGSIETTSLLDSSR